MKAAAVAVLLLLLTSSAFPADEKAKDAALLSAQSWLALVDWGRYSESWEEAASYFKANVSKESWESAMRGAREPLGEAQSRQVRGVTYTKSLPGVPDGEYVVLQFATSFAKKKSAVETVTPMLDGDGKWRVSGYFIK